MSMPAQVELLAFEAAMQGLAAAGAAPEPEPEPEPEEELDMTGGDMFMCGDDY